MKGCRYFLSYAHRDQDWARVLHANLEAALGKGSVDFDEERIPTGRTWRGPMQRALSDAEKLILVVTPEAIASACVEREWDAFAGRNEAYERTGRLILVQLADTPLPPFLAGLTPVDFRGAGEAGYRAALARLMHALDGVERDPPRHVDLPTERPPALDAGFRDRAVTAIEPFARLKVQRDALCAWLGAERGRLEGHASRACTASAALVLACASDEPIAGTIRLFESIERECRDDFPADVAAIVALRKELESAAHGTGRSHLLVTWLECVVRDGAGLRFVGKEIAGVSFARVRVPLRARARGAAEPHDGEPAIPDRLTIEQLLALDRTRHPWITGRFVVLGHPGSGKTTLLRHLAAEVAAAALANPRTETRVPIYASLPALVRHDGSFLAGLEKRLARAHDANGLAAALDHEGKEGRLLVLLDGLDELRADERENERADAESLIRDLGTRWPDATLVVTSRPIGYRGLEGTTFREVELLDLARGTKREFLAKWFGRRGGAPDVGRADDALAVLERHESTTTLSGNPLYLTLMALLLERGETPDQRRAKLYDQVFDLLLDGKHRDPPTPIDHRKGVEAALRHLAYELTVANEDGEPRRALEARLFDAEPVRRLLDQHAPWRSSPLRFLDDVAAKTGVLGPHDGPDADWTFRHRSFREALAAKQLEERYRSGGAAAILDSARAVHGDEARWAEPHALLAGRIAEPDALIVALCEATPALGLRALATAEGVKPETIAKVLAWTGEIEERGAVLRSIVEKVGDVERGLLLLDRMRRDTRDGNDLYFIAEALAAAATDHPELAPLARRLRRSLFDHIDPPPAGALERVPTASGSVPFWREIPAGSFEMGGHDEGSFEGERPVHPVTFSRPFEMASVPITLRMYRWFDPEHGGSDDDPETPAVGVSWYEAVTFCRYLDARCEAARGARLPSEAEWESACRAGTKTAYWSGDRKADLGRIGWYDDNSGGRLHRVGEKGENPWGLFDVHGNVWEWCEDTWHGDYAGAPADGTAWVDAASASRVCRGGCFRDPAWYARSAFRIDWLPDVRDVDLGFRPARPITP